MHFFHPYHLIQSVFALVMDLWYLPNRKNDSRKSSLCKTQARTSQKNQKKNQIQEFAPEYMKKSAFSNSEKKKLEKTCGSVPDSK